MSDALVKQSLAELQELVRCRCHPAYTGRGLHDPECECDSAEAVEVVGGRIKELEAKLAKAVEAGLENILSERGAVFDAMVEAAEDVAGKHVSFNVVIGHAIRAALAALATEPQRAALDRLIAEAVERGFAEGMGTALKVISSIGHGETHDVERGHDDAFRAVQKYLMDWKADAIRNREKGDE